MSLSNVEHADSNNGMRLNLLSAFFATIAAQSIFFDINILPFHDTFSAYHMFHYFVNHFYYNADFPTWFPHALYGRTNDAAQWSYMPTMYSFMLVVGKVLDIKDTLFLFKVASMGEVLLYVIGVSFIAIRYFSTYVARFLVISGSLLSVSWLSSYMFNFHVFYMLPLAFFYIFLFYDEGNFYHLLMCFIILMILLIGNLPYIAPIHLLMFLVLVVFLFVSKLRFVVNALPSNWMQIFGFVLAIFFLIMMAYYIFHSLDYHLTNREGRDPETDRVLLETFLTFGRPTIGTALQGFFFGRFPHGGLSYYIGWLPLILFFLGMVTIRHTIFWGITVMAITLIWLSVGGVFAELVYHTIPTMDYFRSIGMVYGFISMLILIGSGFALDRLAKLIAKGDYKSMKEADLPLFIVSMIVIAAILADIRLQSSLSGELLRVQGMYLDNELESLPSWPYFFSWRMVVNLLGFALFFIWMRRWRDQWNVQMNFKRLSLGVMLIFFLDIGMFQYQLYREAPRYESVGKEQVFQTTPHVYFPQRQREVEGAVSRDAMALLRTDILPYIRLHMPSYASSFAQIDPCTAREIGGAGIMFNHILDMMNAACPKCDIFGWGKNVGGVDIPSTDLNEYASQDFRKLVGCGYDKLRLVSSATFVEDRKQAYDHLKKGVEPWLERVLLSHEDPEVVKRYRDQRGGPKEGASPPAPVDGEIKVTDYSVNHLQLRVSLKGKDPAWLVYAEAWHPHWKAYLNGQEQPLFMAYGGFKAVQIPPGEGQTLLFRFEHGLQGWIGTILIVSGVLFGLFFFVMLFYSILKPGWLRSSSA